ncbi:MAG TPA: ChbG/HpnK family deacetylase [Vicinamibacterales bacterium]|nr:ChbG/HpnK family deacetylase [Vicinamibacterales bacterium]
MTATRRLIVNGDDFGLTPGVNAGIVDAHRRGILTSASVFANAPATAEALAIARRTPSLGVGCHLALVDGEPLSPPSTIPTLLRDGRFRPTWTSFAAAVLARRIRMDQVERELSAQIDRVRSSGVRPSHLDAHKHVHACPPVFAVVVALAKRFGIPRVRIPWERPAAALAFRVGTVSGARRQALENLALTPWAWRDARLLAAAGLERAPWFLGRVLTGLFDADSFAALLASTPPGTSELMMHPGYVDAALHGVRTRLRSARAREVALLTSADARRAIERAGIILVTHRPHSEPHSHAS